jgi:hypothetical protein
MFAFLVSTFRVDFGNQITLKAEMLEISEPKKYIFFLTYYNLKIKDLSNTGHKIGSIIVSNKFKNKTYQQGGIIELTIEKNECSSWIDFFKIFNNYYDYNIISINKRNNSQ